MTTQEIVQKLIKGETVSVIDYTKIKEVQSVLSQIKENLNSK